MDDNNYMNNDNRSSGTPDNTGVFGQSSETANGSDTYSQPQDTYNQPTDTYNQSVSQQESGNAYAYGQSSDQTGSTDGYVNNSPLSSPARMASTQSSVFIIVDCSNTDSGTPPTSHISVAVVAGFTS